jgi:hypothetical protein
VTEEEKLIVERLKATYADVEEMEKVFDIVVNTLALREAEIEQLKAEAEKDYEAMRAFQRKFIEADHQLRFAKVLLGRGADALEHLTWLSQEYCGLPSQCHDLIAELRKAAQRPLFHEEQSVK